MLSFKGKFITSRLSENNYLLEDELCQEWELMQTEAEVCVKLSLIEKWEQHVKSKYLLWKENNFNNNDIN